MVQNPFEPMLHFNYFNHIQLCKVQSFTAERKSTVRSFVGMLHMIQEKGENYQCVRHRCLSMWRPEGPGPSQGPNLRK